MGFHVELWAVLTVPQLLSHFQTHYRDLRWPIASSGEPGLRLPQAGALHSIAAHFSQKAAAAIITMPTGSGKTAVLCASPYLLRSRRVLVLTPSRLVREQIVEEFKTHETLRALGMFSESTPAPRTFNARLRIRSPKTWKDLEAFDVVVGTPHSLSPHISTVPEPPAGLFDLILIDEAHHSPADLWARLLKHFADANQILFTATPFRTDRRRLPGTFAYTYDLKAAYEDGVFGNLHYEPVTPNPGEDVDVATARAAEARFRSDRDNGLDHLLMVRTGQVARAHYLAELYAKHTSLRLAVVTGDMGLRSVRRIIGQLGSELDGLICVDMLGEGFNLPALKIAVLHSPHRTLAVTLQFIGRFARTTGPRLGRATFLALPSEMMIESAHLFREGAVWQDILQNLSASRIAAEQRIRSIIATFRETASPTPDIPDLSLFSLRPFLHAKILNAGPNTNVAKRISMPADAEIVHRHVSDDHNTVVYVARRKSRPKWTTASHLDTIEYDLHILHLHPESGLLFVCTSARDDDVYLHFAEELAPDDASPLRGVSPVRLNRILRGLQQSQFYNIGMRSAAATNREMSYKTIVGSAVDQSIELNDARGFYRGHWFGRAVENGRIVTIGLSAGSKVWSNTGASISSLIDWCDHLARKILDDSASQTLSGLDNLSIGEEATALPPNVVFVDWPKDAYTHPQLVRYTARGGAEIQAQLLDLDLRVDLEESDEHAISLVFTAEDFEFHATFSFETNRLIESASAGTSPIRLEPGGPDSFLEYLNEHPPALYTRDLACLDGFTLFPSPRADTLAFSPDRIEVLDWSQLGVNITDEVESSKGRSVHDHLTDWLPTTDADAVLYDHGAGEIADFMALTLGPGVLRVDLYHCKGSSSPTPGARVQDAYEICGQAIKSQNWRDRRRLSGTIHRRVLGRGGRSRFIRGSLDRAEQLLNDSTLKLKIRVILVQPGISKAALNPALSLLLASVDESVYGPSTERIRVMGSA